MGVCDPEKNGATHRRSAVSFFCGHRRRRILLEGFFLDNAPWSR